MSSTVHQYDYAIACLKTWLDYRTRNTDIPGLSVTIRVEKTTLFSQTYGMADVEHDIPLRTDHLFTIASQSKMFTAVAIQLLSQEGRLRLDDPIVEYLPWLKDHPDRRFATITIRQLLCHRAGLLRDGKNADYWRASQNFPDEKEMQQMVLNSSLAINPNSSLKYSNIAYALLGDIIKRVSNETFASYVSKHIINPLRLTSTLPDYEPAQHDRMVVGYGHMFERRLIPLEHTKQAKTFSPVTGAYSTTKDMAKFMDIYLYDGLLSTESRREMSRLQARVDDGYDAGMEFGLGLEIYHSASGRLFGHTGHVNGIMTATYSDAVRGLTISVGANSKDAPIQQIIFGIFSFLDILKAPFDERLNRFNALLCNSFSTVAVFATEDGFIAADPDDWMPFACYDTLTMQDVDILQFTTAGSAYQAGETLDYTFSKNGTLHSARLAGSILWPEAIYRRAGYPTNLS